MITDIDVDNIQPARFNAVIVTLPSRTNIIPTHVAILKNTKLPIKEYTYHLLKQMKHKILLSLGKLYDCNIHILLTKNKILTYNNKSNELLMKGDRSSMHKMSYLHIDNNEHKL